MYGLGKPTGFELPGERAGLVPDRQWKRENFKRADNQIWYEAETMDVAIGQGALQTTPLQMASAIAAIGNGGTIYRPYVVQKVLSPEGEELKSFQPVATGQLQVSPDTLAVLRQGMQDVTDPGGTAYGAFAGFPVAVGGKTGTAQNSQGDDHAWFVALAPIEDPEVAIVVFIEQGGSGGGFAAPVARKVLASYFNVEQKEEQAAQKASSQGAENESDGGQTPSQEQSAPEEEPQAQELPSDVPALPPSNNTSPEEQEEAEQLDEG